LRRKLLVLRSPKPRPGRGLRCTPLLTVQNPSTSRSTNGTCPKCDVTSRQIKKSRVSHSDSDFFHLRRPLELTLTSEVRDRSHTHTYTSKRVSHSHLTPWSLPCVSRHSSSAAQRKLWRRRPRELPQRCVDLKEGISRRTAAPLFQGQRP